MARIVGYATSGLAPKLLLMTPVESIRKLLTRTGWRLEDVDLFEINEAFAAQMVAIIKELGLDAGARQRQRRRDRAWPPHRRQRRARAHDAAVCHEGSGRTERHRVAVSGRRQRRGAGSRDVTKSEERKANSRCSVSGVCFIRFSFFAFRLSVSSYSRIPRQETRNGASSPNSHIAALIFPMMNSSGSQ